MLYFIIPVLTLTMAYMITTTLRKRRKLLRDRYCRQAYDDADRLIIVIKHARTDFELNNLQLEIQNFLMAYSNFVDATVLKRIEHHLRDRVSIRRVALKIFR